jgi:probable biosynthetic protein (TIGR04098 family)
MLDGGSLSRQVTVAPGMCGASSLVFGRIGDWTWEAVAASCGTPVHRARTAEGRPAYLSFYYFGVRGGRIVHPHGLTFGDELDVTSRVFGFGSVSTLTLHRLAPADAGLLDTPLEADEFYERPHPDCLYVENLNRWVSRGGSVSNRQLVEVAPPEFTHEHLPRIPNRHSPRTVVGRARTTEGFYAMGAPGFALCEPVHVLQYQVDVVRDLNGVGLMYFASYFAIFDTALHGLWRSLGRTDGQFLRRRVVDQKIGYFANADPGVRCEIAVRRWCAAATPSTEIVDLVMRDVDTDRLLAVTGIRLEIVA